ncbi:MAG: hypothetical protein U0228_34305 [Myxococcaceae bacterium]
MKQLSLVSLVLMSGCGPQVLKLADLKLAAPRFEGSREGSTALSMLFSWDTKKVPCGPIDKLSGRVDKEQAVVTNAAVDMSKPGGCAFPTLTLAPASSAAEREVILDDDRNPVTMTVTTLESAHALPTTVSHTLHVGDAVSWSYSNMGSNIATWKITWKPTSGDEVTWAEGTGPIPAVGANVPAGTAMSSGTVTLFSTANAIIRGCTGADLCTVDVTDRSAWAASVVP